MSQAVTSVKAGATPQDPRPVSLVTDAAATHWASEPLPEWGYSRVCSWWVTKELRSTRRWSDCV